MGAQLNKRSSNEESANWRGEKTQSRQDAKEECSEKRSASVAKTK
jgi:hypothetical protein